MVINQEYDVFIAYHGTADEKGSRVQAEAIYDYLTSEGIKCFLFSKDKKEDIYKANFLKILQSKMILLVCNDQINRTENGELDRSPNYHLYVELDAFLAIAQSDKATKSLNDAKLFYITSDPTSVVNPSPETIHPLFANRDSFIISDSSDNETKLGDLLEWIEDRLDVIDTEESSSELVCVMNGRQEVLSKKIEGYNFKRIVRNAKCIKCSGISNWTFTLTDACKTLINGIKRGTRFEMVFLDPDSEWTFVRANEENKNTRTQIVDSLDMIRSEMEAHYIDKPDKLGLLDLYLYDQIPRDNIILIYTEEDAFAFVQSYSRTRPGSSGMLVILRKNHGPESPLFENIEGIYESIRADDGTKAIDLREIDYTETDKNE